MTDAIYTPPDLAAFLIAEATVASPRHIADFAAGDGALLRAAAKRWPNANLFGSDIDPQSLLSINSLLTNCITARHDFLSDDGDGPLDGQSFDLILLNPPFSCRGNARHWVEVDGERRSGSKALAFAARALRFLAPDGEVIAILPASVLVSERDADLLKALESWGSVDQIGEIRTAAFKSHAVSVAVLRISKRKSSRKSSEKPLLVSLKPFSVEVSRGSVSMNDYVFAESGLPFVHTTDMKEGRLNAPSRRASSKLRRIEGATVFIPRVGRPSRDKIVFMPDGEVVLSDCVIALQTSPRGSEELLAAVIRENWDTLKSAYGGSCAPYTTLQRLSATLLRLGIANSIMRAGEKSSTNAAEPQVGSPEACVIEPIVRQRR